MKILVGTIIIVAGLFLLSAPYVLGQTCLSGYCPCKGNFDCDKDVDGSDAAVFKQYYGVSPFNAVCRPHCQAPLPKTGQTITHATGDDGDLEMGVIWEEPRFYDNGDGTITDGLTGLIWLKNANCFGPENWYIALSDCNGLADGSCGLTDGSSAGQWRLPNRNELNSLINISSFSPPISNTTGTGPWSEGDPFTNLMVDEYYWTSSYRIPGSTNAWIVGMVIGIVVDAPKTDSLYVWPVRGPE